MSKRQTLAEVRLNALAERVKDDQRFFLTAEQCAQHYWVSERTWWRWLKLGLVPQPFRVGRKYTRWGWQQLERWEAEGMELTKLHEQDQRDNDAIPPDWTPDVSAEVQVEPVPT